MHPSRPLAGGFLRDQKNRTTLGSVLVPDLPLASCVGSGLAYLSESAPDCCTRDALNLRGSLLREQTPSFVIGGSGSSSSGPQAGHALQHQWHHVSRLAHLLQKTRVSSCASSPSFGTFANRSTSSVAFIGDRLIPCLHFIWLTAYAPTASG